jgi:hypothetical protein
MAALENSFSNPGPDFQQYKDDPLNKGEVYEGDGLVYEWIMECEIPNVLRTYRITRLNQSGEEDVCKLMRAMVGYATLREYSGQGQPFGGTKFLEDLFRYGLNFIDSKPTLELEEPEMVDWTPVKEDFFRYFQERDNPRVDGSTLRLWYDPKSERETVNANIGTSHSSSSVAATTLPAITITQCETPVL